MTAVDDRDAIEAEVGSFGDLVRRLWDGDLYTTADKVEVELDLNEAQKESLRDVLVNAVRMVMRSMVHRNEEQIDERPKPAKGATLDVEGDPRFKFLKDAFALPNGTFVTWGEATVQDHEARLGMLHKLRDGLERTISKHQSVMAQIVQSKVRCLNDLYRGGTT